MKHIPCEFCSRLFLYRPRKRFCSDRCRFKAWDTGINQRPCAYCGVPADTVDHVPPISIRGSLVTLGETRWPFIEVPACHECNNLFGDRPPWTVLGRKAEIKKLLRKRYRKYLAIPEWEDREIMEHDPRGLLGSYIREGIFIRDVIRKRLKW